MHKIIGAPIIEQLPLPLSSSRLLQKQSHSSRHGIRPIPRWRSSTSSPSLPVIPIEQPGSKEYFFSSESTNACRSRSTKRSTSRARLPARGRINRSARSPTEGIFIRLLVRGDLRALYSYLDVHSHQFVDPLKVQAERTRVVHSASVQHGLGRDRRLD